MNEQIEKQKRKELMYDMLHSGWTLKDVIDVNKSSPYEVIELGLCELQRVETSTTKTEEGEKITNLVIYEADDFTELGVYRLIVKGSSDMIHYLSDDNGSLREITNQEDIFDLLFKIERDMTIKNLLGYL